MSFGGISETSGGNPAEVPGEESRTISGRLARNSVILLVARLASASAGMVVLPVLYGRLGEREFGIWAMLTGLVALAGYADLGLGSAQTREVARAVDLGRHRQARAVMAVGVLWGGCLGILALTGTAICWPWLAPVFHLGDLATPARDAVLVLLLGFLLRNLALSWRAVFEGTQHYGPIAVIDAGTAVASAALTVVVAMLGGGLVALAAALAVVDAGRALTVVIAARRHAPTLTPSLRCLRRSDLRETFGYGVRIQVTNTAAAINNETDRLVLAGFFGPSAVAGFEPGSRLANLLRLLPVFALTAMFPAAATVAASGDSARLDRLHIGMTRYLTTFAMVGAAVMMVTADPLVRLWLGHPVPFAAVTVALLAPGYAVHLASAPARVVTRAEGYPGAETRYALLSAGLNVVLTLPLLRVLGMRGVPLATTLAVAVATAYYFGHVHRKLARPLAPVLHAMWPPTLAASVAGSLTWLAAPYLPGGADRAGAALAAACQGALTVCLAALILVLLGYFDAHDRARLRTALTSLRKPNSTTRLTASGDRPTAPLEAPRHDTVDAAQDGR